MGGWWCNGYVLGVVCVSVGVTRQGSSWHSDDIYVYVYIFRAVEAESRRQVVWWLSVAATVVRVCCWCLCSCQLFFFRQCHLLLIKTTFTHICCIRDLKANYFSQLTWFETFFWWYSRNDITIKNNIARFRYSLYFSDN